MTTHYQAGRDAALRGCHRLIVIAPTDRDRDDWYRGYDSVPVSLRGTLPVAEKPQSERTNTMTKTKALDLSERPR